MPSKEHAFAAAWDADNGEVDALQSGVLISRRAQRLLAHWSKGDPALMQNFADGLDRAFQPGACRTMAAVTCH